MRKKFYLVLFLFALLGTAGAWAVQTTYVVTKANGTWFWPDGNPVNGTSWWATKFVSSDNVLTLESSAQKINSNFATDNGFRINHGDLGLAIVSYTLSVPQNYTIVSYTFGAAPNGGTNNIMKISPNGDMSGAISVRKTPVEGVESQTYYTQQVGEQNSKFYLQQPDGAVDVTLTVVVETPINPELAVRDYLTADKIDNVNHAGQYGYPKTTTSSYENIMSLVDKLDDTNAEWTNADYENVASYYEAYLAETDIVVPEAGKFYRIYCDNGTNKKYITEKDGKIWGLVNPEDKATIWYMDGNNMLTALSTGYQYAGSSSTPAAMGLTGTAVAFQKSNSTFGKMNVVPPSAPSWFVQISTTEDGDLKTGGDNLPGARFNVEEVDALPITISDAGLATFYSPVAVTVPEGVTAYTGAISENRTALNLTPVREGDTIPANTAVILEKTGEGEVSLPIAEAASVAEAENEVFTGTISTIATPTDVQILTLQNREGKTGFYPYNGETLAGFKAYLTMNGSAAVKGIVLNFGMTDAIREIVKDGQQAEAIYDLTGRRVEKSVKGIYIVNGKKTVIK